MNIAGFRSRTAIATFIVEFRDRYGVSPTYREIADAVDLTLSTVHDHVQILIHDGVLRTVDIPGHRVDHSRCVLPTDLTEDYVSPRVRQ